MCRLRAAFSLWGWFEVAATRLIALHKNKGKSVAACLKSRTDYAQNPDKTEQGQLVSSYKCSPLTVDEEFMLSKRQYELVTGRRQKNDVIAYQIRQSFKPGEITAEEANKVGYELAMRFTKGKYAFLVATHTDREHIHNHIIYNSTALDCSRKFRDFLLSGLAVQRLSDLICLEHSLSVIEIKPYRERQKRVLYPPKESNRDQLCGVIDSILADKPSSYEEFLKKLEQQGYAETAKKKKIVTSAIEHKAILETVSELQKEGFKAAFVKPDATGRVPVQKILNEVTEHTLAVRLMHVNNETGIIQPVEQLGNELEKRKVLFHVDATQSCGKLVEEIKKMKYDMLSFSAHKLGGPQGIGVLVLRKKNYKLPPVKAIMYGGPQEHGIRPGTVPVALVAGCGKACEIAELEYIHRAEKLKFVKDLVLQMLGESGLDFTINGDQNYCMNNTLNVCLHGVSSEALMILTKQYCGISNGSACTSKSYSPSYVLLAMGVPVEQIENSVRISWGADTDPDLLKAEFSKMLSMAKKLAQ